MVIFRFRRHACGITDMWLALLLFATATALHDTRAWSLGGARVRELARLDTTHLEYRSQYRRQGDSRSLRIKSDLRYAEQDLAGKTQELDYLRRLVPRAISSVDRMLRLTSSRRGVGPLRFARQCKKQLCCDQARDCGNLPAGECKCAEYFESECAGVAMAADYLDEAELCDETGGGCKILPAGRGIADADVLLYVTLRQATKDMQCGFSKSSGLAAFASTCAREQFDRPIGGIVNLCPY